ILFLKCDLSRTCKRNPETFTSKSSPLEKIPSKFCERPFGIKQTSHAQHGRVAECSMESLKMIQYAFREEVVPSDDQDAFRILSSRELRASRAFLNLAKDLGLSRILYSRSEPWVNCILAMVAGRIVFQGKQAGPLQPVRQHRAMGALRNRVHQSSPHALLSTAKVIYWPCHSFYGGFKRD
ncbi:MAG: hypothetical protein L3J79_11025, partial [Candidatus Marinimicrobia bacterium]|nr:hypothetical protein [Candidatus Neomarinimicrobiota bacterium]